MRVFVALLSLAVLSACTSYSGLRPLYPDVGHPVYHVVNVGTLQPTLRWEASSSLKGRKHYSDILIEAI